MKNIKIDGEDVVDLTDDEPCGTSTETQDIQIISESRASFQRVRVRRRRRQSNDSDVVIVDDQVVNNAPPIQSVVCHVFYPEDDDGEGAAFDPLAPVPEWVDCSTLQSEQVTVNHDHAVPEESAVPFAFDDPLCVTGSVHRIKTEPNTEVDVKPSTEQLAAMMLPGKNTECSVLKKIDNNKIVSCMNKESLNNNGDIVTNDKKRKNSLDMDVNDSIPETKLRKVGPKCAAFRKKGAKINITETKGTSSETNNVSKKIGPKCAKLRRKEQTTSAIRSEQNTPLLKKLLANEDSANSYVENCNRGLSTEEEAEISTSNLHTIQSDSENINLTSKKVGPKCARFRIIERTNKDARNQKQLNQKNSHMDVLSPPIKTKKIGPKCAKFRMEEKTNSDASNAYELNQKNSQINVISSPKKTKKIGPKCAKFRMEERTNSDASNPYELNKKNSHMDSLPSQNKSKKIGPKCARFRMENRTNPDESNSNHLNLENSLTNVISSSNKRKKIGPKCAKLRMEEQKAPDLKSLHRSILKTKETGQIYAIKPAYVAIGPKLPLPHCFQQINTPPQEAVGDSRTEFKTNHFDDLENDFDQDHIVLKIYTCFKCSHKCTDALFHEEHMKRCGVKLRSKLNYPQFIPKSQFYKCQICVFKFLKQENARKHMASHGVQGFICHICQMTYPTIFQLNQHNLIEHKNMEKVYSCNMCDYSSQNVYILKDHMVKHNEDKYLYCSFCKRNYEDAESIDDHMETVHGRIKKTSFKTNEIKQYGIIVEKEKDFIKSEKIAWPRQAEASKSASVIENFETQVIARDGKYHCNGCYYKFDSLKNLTNHKKYHFKNKPFTCCNSSFVTFSFVDLSKHVRENHSNYQLSCSMCPSTFKESLSLAKHMIKHINDGLFCDKCQENFETPADYKKHICKPNNSNNCTECPFSTTNSEYFKKHMSRHQKIKNDYKLHLKVKPTETIVSEKVIPNETCVNGETNKSKTKKVIKKIVPPEHSDDELTLDSKISSFTCSVCCSTLNNMDALQQHMKNEHEKSSSKLENDYHFSAENEAFKCKKCSFKSLQPSSFIDHMKNGHKKCKFVCNVCRTEFAYVKLYLDHMKNHAACAVIYSCNECRFNSKKRQVFSKHIRTHTLRACPLCDYKTLKLGSLKSHLESIHTIDNECSSTQHTNNRSSANVSNEQSSGMFDSTSRNGNVKSHACCFCAFVAVDIDSLRSHMAVHFIKDSDSEKGIVKPGLSEERLENESVSTDTSKTKKVFRKKRHTMSIDNVALYSCSKCEYKKKNRSQVSLHFLHKHGIRGSVRKNTIKKLIVPKTEYSVAKTRNSRDMNLSKPVLNSFIERRVSATSDRSESDENDSLNNNRIDQNKIEGRRKTKEKSHNNSWSCKSCDFQKLSLLAQIQHRKFGHLGFWERPFWCKFCGFRSGDKPNLIKHLKWKHNNSKKETSENLKEFYKKNETLDKSTGISRKKIPCHKVEKTGSSCNNCDIDRLSFAAQNQHAKFGHDAFWNRSISCDICDMRFLLKRSYILHNKFLHKSKTITLSKQRQKHPSQGRAKVFHDGNKTLQTNSLSTTKEETETKEFNSDDDEIFACGECDYVTRNVTQFSTHMFIHSGIPLD